MPYERKLGRFERARSIGHVPIVKNEIVKERLMDYRVYTPNQRIELDPGLITEAGILGDVGEPFKWIMAFDGSQHEVAVREEYPSTRIGYIQIAAVLVDLETLLDQRSAHLVDPNVIYNSSKEALHSIVVPSSNVCRKDMPTVKDSWRAEIYDIFSIYTVEEIPLLDIYMSLITNSDKLSKKGGVIVARCPASETCEAINIDVPIGATKCPSCGGEIYPTDALRIHEEVSEEHGNLTALGRLMGILEHITMAGYLSFLIERQPRVLGTVAFIFDGPLALFGPQAWLHVAMLTSINRIRAELSEKTIRWPIIIGIEKTGQFAEHAEAISESIRERCLMSLTDDYIYKHILAFRQSSSSSFGRDTYYGQKFFYKTAQGQLLTITIPKPINNQPDPFNPIHYPDLPYTLFLLDHIGTKLYKDAVIPISLAHSFASIPLRTGSKVLKPLSQEFLGGSGDEIG